MKRWQLDTETYLWYYDQGNVEEDKMMLVEAKVMDPTHLELAKPIAAGRGGSVLVVVAESTDEDAERRQWLDGSAASLQGAYGHSEPDYAPAMVRETNPDYVA